MKVIFLDVDGVLNSLRTCMAFDGWRFPPHQEKDFMRSQLRLDPIAIGLIRKLCEKTGAKIVLSSSWRKMMELRDFKRMLVEVYGWPEPPVLDKTPVAENGHRGDEIRAWLQAIPTVTAHVIIDDDADFYPDQPLVQTRHGNGFTWDDFIKAARYLGLDDVWGDAKLANNREESTA